MVAEGSWQGEAQGLGYLGLKRLRVGVRVSYFSPEGALSSARKTGAWESGENSRNEEIRPVNMCVSEQV